MGNVISNLKARFGVDTSDFKKGLKDGEKATNDFKGAAGNALDQFASLFGVSMGGVNDSINTANNSLKFLGSSFKAAADGGNKLTIGLKLLKFALAATGIGALIVLLGSVVAYFTKSGEGSDKLARILAQLKSVLDNVVDRMVAFGKGVADFVSGKFKKGIEEMGAAFKGMGAEIVEDWKASGQLADALDALDDKEISLIATLEERKQKVAELRLASKDLELTEQERLDKIIEAERLIMSVYGDQVSIEKERFRIMKETLAMASSDPTDDQRRELAEQEAKINSLLRAQAEELRSLSRERNTLAQATIKDFEAQKKADQANKMSGVQINGISLDLKPVQNTARSIETILQEMNLVVVDVTSSINSAFEDVAVGMGEFFGSLASGDADLKDFGKMVAGTFADLAIHVGKIAIGAGFAVLGIKKALMSLNPYVAIAAGIALVGLGFAVKGALSNAASGGGGGSMSSASSGAYTFDARSINTSPQAAKVQLAGEFTIRGRDLVYVVDQENNRRKQST